MANPNLQTGGIASIQPDRRAKRNLKMQNPKQLPRLSERARNRNRPPPRLVALAIVSVGSLASCIVTATIHAADVVYFTSPHNRQARTKVTGEIVDYTGREIVIKLDNGRDMKRPGGTVAEIETIWQPDKLEADRLMTERQFSAAREKYTAAVKRDKRPWARRLMVARIIRCYRELEQYEPAGRLFLALVGEDLDTPYFDQIPLVWLTMEPAVAVREAAGGWLADGRPVARLLGASHLLTTARRQDALEQLELLTREKDARLAILATAQYWRASVASADADRVAGWQRRVTDVPETLRAGPWWVIGRAWARLEDVERAALAMLHVPVLYPQERALSADALLSAAQLLDAAGQPAAAMRLNQELISRYPGDRLSAQLSERLQVDPDELPLPPSVPIADTPVQAFLIGLRERRLFDLAVAECQERLSDSGITEVERIDLTIELSRTFMEQALEQRPDARDAYWRRAVEALDATRGLKGSRLLLIELQRGLIHLARGELGRQEGELAGAPEKLMETARQELREAIATFERVKKEEAAALRELGQSKRAAPDGLTSPELIALRRNVDFQLSRAQRNQGQSYPPRSDDRVNSLRQAAERLAALPQFDEVDAITWRSRLDEITCLLLLEDYGAAHARVAKLSDAEPPPETRAGLLAERIRLALAEGKLPAALSLAEEAKSATAPPSPDVDFACLQAYTAAWRAAAKQRESRSAAGQPSDDAGQWQDRAAAQLRQIDRRWGPYWSRRAEMVLASSVTGAGGAENVTVLARAAESFYRGGQIDQALAAYDRATDIARQAGDADGAFDHAYTAAAIEQELHHHQQAALRFRELAIAAPDHARAAEAHLLAIYNTAQAAKDESKQSDEPTSSSEQYLTLLKEHLATWPRSPTANQARMWQGRLAERDEQWADAVAAYRAVTADARQATEAVTAAGRVYRRWLSELAANQRSTQEVAKDAAQYFEGLISSDHDRLPERWSETQRWAATSAASIWLEHTDDGFARAERVLSAALADAAEAPSAWRTSAEVLRVFAVAAQGRREQAGKLLAALAGGDPRQMLALVEQLARASATSSAQPRRELAELALQAASRLQKDRGTLSADERRIFDLAYIHALADAGRRNAALQAARRLAKEYPRDGQAQEQLADLLVEAADWKAALAAWREIGHRCREGSDRWLRSVYYQALVMKHLGQSKQAARLIKLTEGSHPRLGGPELADKFHELLKQCEKD